MRGKIGGGWGQLQFCYPAIGAAHTMSTTDNWTITFLFYVSLLTFCARIFELRRKPWREAEHRCFTLGAVQFLFPGIPPRPIFTYVCRCERSRCCRAKSRAVTGPDIDRPSESWTRDGFGSSNWTIRPQKLSNDPRWAQFSFSSSYVVRSPSSTLIFIL